MSEDTLSETVTYRGFKIQIHYDQDASNPRRDMDNAGSLMGRDSYFTGGDDDDCTDDLGEWLSEMAYGLASAELQKQIDKFDPWGGEAINQDCWTRSAVEAAHDKLLTQAQEELEQHLLWAPCCIYTNSTQPAVELGGWGGEPEGRYDDGIYYITLGKARKEWGKPDSKWEDVVRGDGTTLLEATKSYLRGEFNTYRSWCIGECFGFLIEDREGEDQIDSCWGFYGNDYEASGLLETAHGAINYHITSQRTKHAEQVKTWIKHKVPLEKREPLNSQLAA